MAAINISSALDASTPQQTPATNAEQKTAVKPHPKPIPIPPAKSAYPTATSPGLLRSSSPRLSSPASSEIFERSVQEPLPISTLEKEPKAHLPTHVITEDFIPPALDQSTQAITSQELNADEVEIVTSSSHQTAAASVLEGSTSQLDLVSLNSPSYSSQRTDDTESVSQSGLLSHLDEETTNYGSIDPNDVRRLSFISFADVVQSEHQHPAAPVASEAGNSPSLSGSLPSSAQAQARSRSPFRSPPSASRTGGLSTPPPSVTRHNVGSELSPVRYPNQPGTHGELTIETMRQAVRKTASGDIGQNFRNPAVSEEMNVTRNRTNA